MAKQRIFSIDALRGFSLLGILLMNILTFAYPYQIINPFEFFNIKMVHGLKSVHYL